MANISGREGMWTPQIWSDIDQAVMADVGRVRVAQKVFPAQQKPNQDNVQADILSISEGPIGDSLMIQEGITLPFFEISAKFILTESQMDNEANLRTAQTLAQLTARKVALAEDLVLFQGAQAQLPQSVTVTNLTPNWQGLLNVEGMLDPINVKPLKSGGFGENTFNAVSQGIGQLIAASHPGPYALILETSMFADTHAPVPNTLVTTADRVNPLVERRFYSTGTFPAHTGLLVSLGGNPTTIHIAQDAIVTTNWQDPFGHFRFRVYERVQVVAREPQAFVKLQFTAPKARLTRGVDMDTEIKHGESVKTILLVGATGDLGGLIARALLAKGLKLRLLVRPGSRAKLAADVATASEIFENEAGAFDGVYTVVSAVQGGPETIVDTQLKFLQAAREAGVRRFIPSDFCFNFFNLAEGENINSDWRREFARRAEEERGAVEVVHVLNGTFLDMRVLFGFLGAFDLEKGEAYLWGDGNEKMEFTTYADTAAYTAEAAMADGPLSREFNVAGDSLTFHELVDETAAGLGRPITVKKLGTLKKLDAEIDRRLQAEPDNMLSWLPLMYWRGVLNGKGKLGPVMNAQYPAIHPTGVREYVDLAT